MRQSPLRHLAAHVSPARYAALRADYQATLDQARAVDVPQATPPAVNGQPQEPPPDDRSRWGALSRRALRAELPPATWEALRAGEYAMAERLIGALEAAPANGQAG